MATHVTQHGGMPWLDNYQIILGSGSPRRVQLLREAGYTYTQRVIEIDESFDADLSIYTVAEHLAILKSAAHTLNDSELLITADSVVIIHDKILGKPKDRKEAEDFLKLLSGSMHLVHTGVCLRSSTKQESFTASSEVTLATLSPSEINHYIEHYPPYDRAGGYGVQDWIGHNCVTNIKGSYTNIMGLPTAELYGRLKAFCID